MSRELQVDREFASYMPDAGEVSDVGLEAAILKEGCRDAVCVWGDVQNKSDVPVIVDGHRRYEVCRRHGLDFPVCEMEFADRDAALEWIMDTQLSRRNLTDEQRTYYLGELARRREVPHGRPGKADTLSAFSTVSDIAEKHSTTPRQVRRAKEYAEAVDTIAEAVPELKEKILKKKAGSAKAVKALAKKPKKEIEKVAKEVESGVKSLDEAVLPKKPPVDPLDEAVDDLKAVFLKFKAIEGSQRVLHQLTIAMQDAADMVRKAELLALEWVGV